MDWIIYIFWQIFIFTFLKYFKFYNKTLIKFMKLLLNSNIELPKLGKRYNAA